MVIRDPSRGPKPRPRRGDRALGHRSHNRPRPDHIESPDSPPIVAASLKDTCRTCQRRRAQSDPPQMSHFVSRRCDRTIGPITRLWGSLWAHVSLREGGENRTRTDRKTRLESRSIIPLMDHLTVARTKPEPRSISTPTTTAPSPTAAWSPPPSVRTPARATAAPSASSTRGAAVVPWTTRPSPPIWPSSTTPAGARASPPWPSPPSAFAPAFLTTRTRPGKRPAASSQASGAPPPIAAEAAPTPLEVDPILRTGVRHS